MSQISVSILLLIAPLLCLVAGCEKAVFSESTQYAPGFTQRRFKAITLGMSVHDVTNRLGLPLAVSTQEWSDAWIYGPKPGLPPVGTQATGRLRYDLFSPFSKIEFGRNGQALSVSGDFLRRNPVGMYKQQITKTFGEPTSIENTPFRLILRYTLPGNRGTYKRREIWLDEGQIVRSKVAELYVD